MLDLKLTDMRFMYLTELRGKDICVGDKKCKRVKIYVGRPLADTPKTYKQIGGFVAKELSNAYNSGCVSIYEAKDKTLRYSVYRDNPEDQLLGFDTVRETVFGMEKELSIDESVNVKFDYEII